MLNIQFTTRFKRDYKAIKKRGLAESPLKEALQLLSSETPLPERFCDHPLGGDYIGFRDCHLQPDWILIYRVDTEEHTLYLARTGTHSDLFR